MSILKRIVSVFLIASCPVIAAAHARLTSPVPRSESTGFTVGPCGGVAMTNSRTTYKPGETVTVSWYEAIPHGGYYRVAFSPGNDKGFDSNVLADNVKTGSAQVTLPITPCDTCSIQLIQVNTSPSNYYSCADIALVSTVPPKADAGTTPPPSADGGTSGGATNDQDGGASARSSTPHGETTSPVSGGCGASTGGSSAALALAFGLALALGRHARARPHNRGRAGRR